MVGVPLYAEGMEVISKIAMWQLICTGECIAIGTMHRSSNYIWLRANVLHDVNFTTGWPAHGVTIATKQPEGWPNALTNGKFDTGFKKSICKAKMPTGIYPGRSILTRPIPALQSDEIALSSLNNQIALTILVNILVVRVIL